MGVGDEKQAVKAFSKQLLQAVASIHKSGVGLRFFFESFIVYAPLHETRLPRIRTARFPKSLIVSSYLIFISPAQTARPRAASCRYLAVVHRDVKPENILFAASGGVGTPKIKLIDLGAAADLRVGTNYSPDETVFDPIYGPPEKYLDVKGVGTLFGLGGAVGWAQSKPDLFDAFSCGMVILQASCPSLRKGKAMGGVKRDLSVYAFDAQAWRDSLPERRQRDFELLDADDGKGWDLVCGMLSQRKKRTSVSSAIGHPFLR